MFQALLLFVRANRRHLLAMAVASALINVFFLAMPLFTMLVYDKAMGNAIHDTLWALCVGMGLLLGQELLLRLARVQVVEHAGARWDMFLDERLCRGLLQAPLTERLAPGEVLSRYREVGHAREILGSSMMLALIDLPFALLFLGVLALIGGPLVWVPALFAVGVLALGLGTQALATRCQVPMAEAQKQRLTSIIDVLSAREGLMGAGAQRHFKQRFGHAANQAARHGARVRWWQQVGQQATPIWLSLATVVLMAWGVLRVEEQALSVGGLIALNLLAGRFLSIVVAIAPLTHRGREFQHSLLALADAVRLSATAPSTVMVPTTALATEGLRLESIGFRYAQANRPTLQTLSLQLPASGMVAVLGNSGAGKSSLLKVLAGLMAPQEGSYQFGGQLISSDTDREGLRHHLAYKSQDPHFLPGTVRQIVTDWADNVDDEPVVAALRMAGLGPQLERNELGLNTPVGTNGDGLSGGQRQMLALAAAFYSRAPVLLLDEPTLGLDRAAQASLMAGLVELSKQRLVCVSTHATELIRLAQRVLVLDQGRIVLDGPPARLLEAKPGAAKAARPTAPSQTAPTPPKTVVHEPKEILQ